MGFANWFRQYMQGYSQQIAELTKLTRKNHVFTWDLGCEHAFQWVKEALANAPVLAHPDFTKQFTVWTDASIDGVGAVLQQEKRPIAYESARFSPAERNYTIGEQELLAVIHALKKWRVYLEGAQHPVRLRTDHQPLTYLPTKGVLGSRQVRWAEYLSRFDIEWEYIPGHRNIADALSRMPFLSLYVTTRSQTQQAPDVRVKPDGEALTGSLIKPKRKQGWEKELLDEGSVAASPIKPKRKQRWEKDVTGALEEANASEGTEEQSRKLETLVTEENKNENLDERLKANEQEFLNRIKEASIQDEALTGRNFRRKLLKKHDVWWNTTKADYMALYVPKDAGNALRNECIEWVHVHPFTGHVGMHRTSEIVRRDFWWPGMEQDVEKYVRDCEMCNRNKPTNRKKAGLLAPLPIPGRPWESIGMDFITHLPRTKAGYTALYVVVDRLTKLVHIVPTTDTATAADVAQLFLDAVFKNHGLPRNIVSDRDVKFTSSFWTAFCEQVGIKLKMSSAYHPETDGQTERTNRIIVDMMRHYISPMQDDWDEHLTAIEFAINNAFQQSIGTTPFRITYGQNPLTPVSLRIPKVENPEALKVTETLQERLQTAKKCLEAAQQRQKAYADQNRRPMEYKPGDEVLISTENMKRSGIGTPKSMPLWIGPFKILKRIEPTAYELELAQGMRMHDVFHVSLLKAWNAEKHGVIPIPPTLTLAEQQEFEVHKIVDHREKHVHHVGKGRPKFRREYLVSWRGQDYSNNTWEPEKNLQNARKKVNEYWETRLQA